MARTTPGLGGSAMRGSVGGLTYTDAGSGTILRNRIIPPNQAKSANFLRKARFAAAAAGWRTLTDLQRAAWNSQAANIQRVDPSGRRYNLAGFQLYVECALNAQEAGYVIPIRPPSTTVISQPIVTVGTASITGATLSVTTSGAIPGTQKRLLYASRSIPGGIRNWRGVPYRLIMSGVGVGTSNRWSVYVGAWGNLASSFAGYRMRLKTVIVSEEGIRGPESVVEVLWS